MPNLPGSYKSYNNNTQIPLFFGLEVVHKFMFCRLFTAAFKDACLKIFFKLCLNFLIFLVLLIFSFFTLYPSLYLILNKRK